MSIVGATNERLEDLLYALECEARATAVQETEAIVWAAKNGANKTDILMHGEGCRCEPCIDYDLASAEEEAKLELLREIRVAAELWRAPISVTDTVREIESARRAEVLRNSDATTPGFFR